MNLTNLLDENDISKFDKIENDGVYAQEQMFLSENEKSRYKKASEQKQEKNANHIEKSKLQCLKKAKKMLNYGKKVAEIKEFIVKHFAAECIPSDIDSMLNRSNNIIGKVIIDCSALDNKQEYNEIPQENKRFHQYAIKCNCHDKKKIYKNENSINQGTIEAYLETTDNWREMPIACEVCPKTNLPILNKLDDYTEEDVDKTIKNIGLFNEKEAKQVKQYSPIYSVKKAFCMLDKKGKKKVSFKVEDFNYNLGKNTNELEIENKGKKDLNITDLKTMNVNIPVCKYEKDLDINDLTPKAIDFNIKEQKRGADVFVNKENMDEFDINDFEKVQVCDLTENKMNQEEKIDDKQIIELIVPCEKSDFEVNCIKEEIIPDFELKSLVDTEWYDDEEQGENIDFIDNEDFQVDGRGQWNI